MVACVLLLDFFVCFRLTLGAPSASASGGIVSSLGNIEDERDRFSLLGRLRDSLLSMFCCPGGSCCNERVALRALRPVFLDRPGKVNGGMKEECRLRWKKRLW